MTNLLDITQRLQEKAEEVSFADAEEVLEKLLELTVNSMMIVTNVNGVLRYQIIRAQRFTPKID